MVLWCYGVIVLWVLLCYCVMGVNVLLCYCVVGTTRTGPSQKYFNWHITYSVTYKSYSVIATVRKPNQPLLSTCQCILQRILQLNVYWTWFFTPHPLLLQMWRGSSVYVQGVASISHESSPHTCTLSSSSNVWFITVLKDMSTTQSWACVCTAFGLTGHELHVAASSFGIFWIPCNRISLCGCCVIREYGCVRVRSQLGPNQTLQGRFRGLIHLNTIEFNHPLVHLDTQGRNILYNIL